MISSTLRSNIRIRIGIGIRTANRNRNRTQESFLHSSQLSTSSAVKLLQRNKHPEPHLKSISNSIPDQNFNGEANTNNRGRKTIERRNGKAIPGFIHTSSLNPHPRLELLRQQLETDAPRLDRFSHKLKDEKIGKGRGAGNSTSNPEKSAESESKSRHVLELLQNLPPLPESTALLTDRFNRSHSYLRISLTERCNLRCQYCMPPEGVPLQPDHQLLRRDEIIHLANIFATHGVDKIRLTGGEPLLRHDLREIVHDLANIDGIQQVGMTTNGLTFKRQMDDLIQAGLTHVNISLDTLKEDKFARLTRRPGLHKVLEAIRQAADAFPQNRVKINCVVMRNTNEDELVDFCNLTHDLPVDIRFIEWMPFFDNGWSQDEGLVPYQEMLQIVNQQLQLSRAVDGPNDTTKWWHLDGALGRIGFITSMSQHFCGTCNRLRLTADGQIKVCLFGSTELSLRDALRDQSVTNKDLETLIHHAIQRKNYSLGGHGTPQGIADANDNRPMTLIGG